MDAVRGVNLGVRFLLELCALAALAYWGWRIGVSMPWRLLLAVGAPLAAAVVWGMFVAPKARFDVGPGVRMAIELAVFAAAVSALVSADRAWLGVGLGAVYAVNRLLIALWDR